MFSNSFAVADDSGSNVLCYSVIATLIAFLLIVEFMVLGGRLDSLSSMAVFGSIDAPSCGLTSFGQDV